MDKEEREFAEALEKEMQEKEKKETLLRLLGEAKGAVSGTHFLRASESFPYGLLLTRFKTSLQRIVDILR